MLNIIWTVEEHTTWTDGVNNFSHPKVYSDVRDETCRPHRVHHRHETDPNKKCWFLYIHLIWGSRCPAQTWLCFSDTFKLIMVIFGDEQSYKSTEEFHQFGLVEHERCGHLLGRRGVCRICVFRNNWYWGLKSRTSRPLLLWIWTVFFLKAALILG